MIDFTWLRSNVSKVNTSESLSEVGEDSLDAPSPSSVVISPTELGEACRLPLLGCHLLTFLAMASTACPEAILVSHDLLLRYVQTYIIVRDRRVLETRRPEAVASRAQRGCYFGPEGL